MSEHPILFGGAMVRAILAGQKTQTRRIITPSPVEMVQFLDRQNRPTGEYGWCPHERVISKHIRCPYGGQGDRLWVRETFMENDPPSGWVYRATDGECGCRPCVLGDKRHRWTPAIYMPRRVSRLTLEVTGVRVERLQDISDDDARAEGFLLNGCTTWPEPARDAFGAGWDQINGKRAPWESNHWVWVVSFRRCDA